MTIEEHPQGPTCVYTSSGREITIGRDGTPLEVPSSRRPQSTPLSIRRSSRLLHPLRNDLDSRRRRQGPRPPGHRLLPGGIPLRRPGDPEDPQDQLRLGARGRAAGPAAAGRLGGRGGQGPLADQLRPSELRPRASRGGPGRLWPPRDARDVREIQGRSRVRHDLCSSVTVLPDLSRVGEEGHRSSCVPAPFAGRRGMPFVACTPIRLQATNGSSGA